MSPVGSAETRGRPPGCGGWATRGGLTVLGDRLATSCLYRCSASWASVLTRSPAGRWIFDAAATSQRIPAADNERASRIPSARLVHHRRRTQQLPDPADDLRRRRRRRRRRHQPRLEHLTRHRIDRRRRDRACMHVNTNTHTLCDTGACHNCRIGRAGGPCSTTHESCERGAATTPKGGHSIPSNQGTFRVTRRCPWMRPVVIGRFGMDESRRV